MYREVKNIIKIPSIEIYFNEYDSFYVNGKMQEKNFACSSNKHTHVGHGGKLPAEMFNTWNK